MIHTLYRRALAMACAVAAISGLGMAADAAAEERPLILVVPYPPGGSTDILARILQPRLSQELGGRAVVVENRPGAASQIATAFVARRTRWQHAAGELRQSRHQSRRETQAAL